MRFLFKLVLIGLLFTGPAIGQVTYMNGLSPAIAPLDTDTLAVCQVPDASGGCGSSQFLLRQNNLSIATYTNNKLLKGTNSWLDGNAQPICTLTDAANIVSRADFCPTNASNGVGTNAVTLTAANHIISLPINLPATGGQDFLYAITHSGYDGPLLGQGFELPGGTQPPECNPSASPPLTTQCWSITSGAVDWLPCKSIDGTHLGCGSVITAMAILAPAWVQTQVDNVDTSNGSTLTFPYTLLKTFTSGDGLVGQAYIVEAGYTLTGVTDNASNTYTILDHVADPTAGVFVATFGKARVSGTPTTITLTFSAAPANGNHVFVWADEISGAGAIDTHVLLANASTTTLTSGNSTTTRNDLVMGFVAPDGGTTITAGSNFTLRLADTTNGLYSESQIQSAAGTLAATFGANPTISGTVGLIALSPP